jgi:hypothetical protein
MIALVERGSFDIREVPLSRRTMDKVRIGSGELSSKPPLLSMVGAGIYALLHNCLDLSFASNEGAVVFVIVALLGTLPLVILLALFWAFIRAEGVDANLALGVTALLGLGTLCFPFGTILVNHLPSTTALFGAFYLSRSLRTGRMGSWKAYAGTGLLAALAVTFEPIAIFPVFALVVYVALSMGGPRPAHGPSPAPEGADAPRGVPWVQAAAFLAGAALPAALHFGVTWHTTGGLLPVQLRPELWHFDGSYWNNPRSWDALAEPKWQYGLLCFFGGRGLITLTPVLLLGFVGIARGLFRSGSLSNGGLPRAESGLFLGGFTLLASYVILRTNNYGGGHYGMRWFLMLVPWLMLAAIPIISWARSGWKRLGLVLLLLPGIYTAQVFWFGKPTVYELLLMRWGILVLPP